MSEESFCEAKVWWITDYLSARLHSYLDNAAFVKAKVNNEGIFCLGYTQALRYVVLDTIQGFQCSDVRLMFPYSPGVKASLGLALNTKGLQDASATSPAHKVGASMVFES